MVLPLKDLDGNVIPDRDEKGRVIQDKAGERPLVVKTVIRTALVAGLPAVVEDEKRKFANYQLAAKILKADPGTEFELESEEVTHIKLKVSHAWGIEVYGFIVDLLEGRNTDWKPSEKAGV